MPTIMIFFSLKVDKITLSDLENSKLFRLSYKKPTLELQINSKVDTWTHLINYVCKVDLTTDFRGLETSHASPQVQSYVRKGPKPEGILHLSFRDLSQTMWTNFAHF